MQSDAITREGAVDSLRYVTQHFRDLQGLRTAPFWGFVLVSAISLRLPHWAFQILVPCGVALVVWTVLSGRWYARRCGFLTAPRAARVNLRVLKVGMLGIAAIFVFSFLRTSGNTVLSFLCFGLMLGSISIQCLLRASESVPADLLIQVRRIGYAAAVVLGVAWLPRLAFVPGQDRDAMLSFALIMCALGLYDHWLLMRLLGGRRGMEPFDAE